MLAKLQTEHHWEFLSFKGACTGSSESSLVKMPHCWKSHALAQMVKLVEYYHIDTHKQYYKHVHVNVNTVLVPYLQITFTSIKQCTCISRSDTVASREAS